MTSGSLQDTWCGFVDLRSPCDKDLEFPPKDSTSRTYSSSPMGAAIPQRSACSAQDDQVRIMLVCSLVANDGRQNGVGFVVGFAMWTLRILPYTNRRTDSKGAQK